MRSENVSEVKQHVIPQFLWRKDLQEEIHIAPVSEFSMNRCDRCDRFVFDVIDVIVSFSM